MLDCAHKSGGFCDYGTAVIFIPFFSRIQDYDNDVDLFDLFVTFFSFLLDICVNLRHN